MFLRCVLLIGLLAPSAASAHAILVHSEPTLGAVVQAGPVLLTLRFNSRIDQARSRLALRREGSETPLPLRPGGAPDQLAAQATVTPGSYTLRWQVLAADGHITRGDVPFTAVAP